MPEPKIVTVGNYGKEVEVSHSNDWRDNPETVTIDFSDGEGTSYTFDLANALLLRDALTKALGE